MAVFAPDGIVIELGTDVSKWSVDSVTTVPPGPAGPVSVIVPVEVLPPRTLVGLTTKVARVAGLTVRVAVWGSAPKVPVITAATVLLTPVVETVNVAEVLPVATITDAGTVTDGSLLESETIAPPGPAIPLKVAVPVDGLPPKTEIGFTDKEESVAG